MSLLERFYGSSLVKPQAKIGEQPQQTAVLEAEQQTDAAALTTATASKDRVKFYARFAPELVEQLREKAHENKRSLSAESEIAIKRYLQA